MLCYAMLCYAMLVLCNAYIDTATELMIMMMTIIMVSCCSSSFPACHVSRGVPVSSQKFPMTKFHSQGVASHGSALQSCYTCVQPQHNSVKLVAASAYQDV